MFVKRPRVHFSQSMRSPMNVSSLAAAHLSVILWLDCFGLPDLGDIVKYPIVRLDCRQTVKLHARQLMEIRILPT